jgi:hypothetical protein
MTEDEINEAIKNIGERLGCCNNDFVVLVEIKSRTVGVRCKNCGRKYKGEC